MIRLNLLDAIEVEASAVAMAAAPGRRRPLFIVALVLLVAVLAGVIGVMRTHRTESVFDALGQMAARRPAPPPAPPVFVSKPVVGKAVEETIEEMPDVDAAPVPAAVAPDPDGGYQKLNPAKKINYQLTACREFLNHLKGITPPEVGFTHVILTVPGDFYLAGMALNEEYYNQLRDGLARLPGAQVKPGINRAFGYRNIAREFSFVGTFQPPAGSRADVRVLKDDEAAAELRSVQNLAATLSMKTSPAHAVSVFDLGKYERRVYRVEAVKCTYAQLRDFSDQMYQGPFNLGILKIAARAEGDDVITAVLDLVVYVEKG